MTLTKDTKSKLVADIAKITKVKGTPFDNLCDKSEEYLKKYLQVVKKFNAVQSPSRS